MLSKRRELVQTELGMLRHIYSHLVPSMIFFQMELCGSSHTFLPMCEFFYPICESLTWTNHNPIRLLESSWKPLYILYEISSHWYWNWKSDRSRALCDSYCSRKVFTPRYPVIIPHHSLIWITLATSQCLAKTVLSQWLGNIFRGSRQI